MSTVFSEQPDPAEDMGAGDKGARNIGAGNIGAGDMDLDLEERHALRRVA